MSANRFATKSRTDIGGRISGAGTLSDIGRRVPASGIPLLLCLALASCGGGGGGDASVDEGAGLPPADIDGGVPGAVEPDEPGEERPDETPGDVQGSNFYLGGNNSALLEGDVVGDGSVDNASLLAEPIPFVVGGLSSDREDVALRSMSGLEDGDGSILVGVVENTTSDLACEVMLRFSNLLDQDGERLDAELVGSDLGRIEVLGTLATLSTSTVSELGLSTCLPPESSAYAIQYIDVSLSDVGRFETDPVASETSRTANAFGGATTFEVATAAIRPVMYAVGSAGEVEFTLVNDGDRAVDVTELTVLHLDGAGLPLGVSRVPTGRIAEPGEQLLITADDIGFPGESTSMRVWVAASVRP